TIKSWLGAEGEAALRAGLGRPLNFVSMLEGRFKFRPKDGPAEIPKFRSVGDGAYKDGLLPHNYGRLGLSAPLNQNQLRRLKNSLTLEKSRPVLVLGTGEFLHPPYRLARMLEDDGFEVTFASTTRTPVALGHIIGSVMRFADNYHDGIDNFLYNVPPESDSQKIICYETPHLPDGHDLAARLGAQTVFFGAPHGAA
ncbi:MAG: TRSP domain-containing protein, partial [Candidatus Adiutrix sp.]|nr:TRSP domain-containing protein [Candidatus Adiutrix sp.]